MHDDDLKKERKAPCSPSKLPQSRADALPDSIHDRCNRSSLLPWRGQDAPISQLESTLESREREREILEETPWIPQGAVKGENPTKAAVSSKSCLC